MRAITRAIVAGAATLLLTACQGTASAPVVNVPTSSPSQASVPTAPSSVRGNLIKHVGETAAWGTDDSVSYVVDKITVDPRCNSGFASRPENGHFVRLDIRVETTVTMPVDQGYSINPYDWKVVGPDGITDSAVATGASFSCLKAADMLPPDGFSPASKYRGSIILDTRHSAGTLIFRPGFLAGGWEWNYGQ